ncbi:MAG: response regulator [Anaerolineae bacterium]|nr:response regulator [Anaerolineae bacterium]
MTQLTALIVEDDRIIADIFSRVLKTGGYETTVIDDGQAALDILAEMTPHVVVLDLNLPTVSGVQILNHMRKEARLKETWVILATANAIQAASIDDDGDDFLFKLLKPISVEQLLRLVSVLKASLKDSDIEGDAAPAETQAEAAGSETAPAAAPEPTLAAAPADPNAAKTGLEARPEIETVEAEAIAEAAEIDDDEDMPPHS